VKTHSSNVFLIDQKKPGNLTLPCNLFIFSATNKVKDIKTHNWEDRKMTEHKRGTGKKLTIIILVVALGVTGLWSVAHAVREARDGRDRFHRPPAEFDGERGPDGPGGPGGPPPNDPMGMFMELGRKLDITEEQHDAIIDIFESYRDKVHPLMQKVVEKKDTLRDAVLADTSSEKTIRAASAELGEAIGDVAVITSEIAAEIKEVLTDEQLEQMERLIKQRDNAKDRRRAFKRMVH